MNKQQLAARIWASANKMRSKIEASEYKDYILGFIFYKYLSDKEEHFMLQEGGLSPAELVHLQEHDDEIVQYCQTNIGYFIAYDNLFSSWLKMGAEFSVQNVTIALSAFERLINDDYKKLFEGVFSSLSVGLSKLGSTAAQQSKAILDLLSLIKDIPTDGRQGYDVLGFIYEYLIGQFAANAGKKAGEFYTPHEVSVLMSEIVASHVRDRRSISIYDPTSGSGSLLLNIGSAVSKHTSSRDNVHYYAQELISSTFNLTRMNLVMRGIKPGNIEVRNADTLEQDWPKDERSGAPTLYLDAVVSNPPYSQPWNPVGKDLDPRYRYGVAPKGKADYAFLLHDLYHLKPDGIMTIVLPHGVLFRGDPAKDEAEGVIRKNLIENNHIDAIIGLPADIFFGTGIATIIMVLRQKRDRDDVLFIDASKGFIKSGKKNKLRASDIRRIVDTYVARQDVDKYARCVRREEIRENGYNLNIPRYVDSSEAAETWDLYAAMYGDIPNREIDALPYWRHLPTLRETLFTRISETHSIYLAPGDSGPVGYIEQDESFRQLDKEFKQTMDGLPAFLQKELLQSLSTVDINKEEDVIASELFRRMKKHPVFDSYAVYQLLDDSWQTISMDLEILQTEGWDKVREVEPNMVLKKKKDKSTGVETEVEIQEGWNGRIMPLELVENVFFSNELHQIAKAESDASACASDIEEKIQELSDENRDKYIDEDDKLLTKELAADVKTMRKDASLRDEELIALQEKLDEQKNLNKKVKMLKEELEMKAFKRIEKLTDSEAYDLLYQKWIKPLCMKVFLLPSDLIAAVEKDVLNLKKRYADTLLKVNEEIEQAEKELANLLGELTGDEADMQAIREISVLNKGLAVAEKLFPQKGNKAPAIRFKGFEGEWEERSISELVVERNEQAPQSSEYPLMAFVANKGIVSKGDRYDRSALIKDAINKPYKRTSYGDFIYSSNNLESGSIGMNSYGNASISPVYSIFAPKDNNNPFFLGVRLAMPDIIREMVRCRQGVVYGQWKIHEDEFLEIKLRVPSENEQNKIASLIENLTSLILLRERQLTLLKHSKQALLEQMFVNE